MPFDIGQKYLLNILMFSEEKSLLIILKIVLEFEMSGESVISVWL